MSKLKSSVGVVIVRIQAPRMHEGHIGLIKHAIKNHKEVIVFIGSAIIEYTKRNPYNFLIRHMIVKNIFPDVITMELKNNRSDEKWSQNVDLAIASIFPDTSAVLYGSRDSFIPHYHGKHTTSEFPMIGDYCATDIRLEASTTIINSEEWRAGVIFGIYKQRPITYPTVDAVVIDNDRMLLVRKPSETLFRFAGGFVDRTDEDYEMAASRELMEETTLLASDMIYVASMKVEDWRYAQEDSGIMTTLYLTHYKEEMGVPEPSDDLKGGEVKWFDIKSLTNENITEYIVPEHVELMKRLLKYLNK